MPPRFAAVAKEGSGTAVCRRHLPSDSDGRRPFGPFGLRGKDGWREASRRGFADHDAGGDERDQCRRRPGAIQMTCAAIGVNLQGWRRALPVADILAGRRVVMAMVVMADVARGRTGFVLAVAANRRKPKLERQHRQQQRHNEPPERGAPWARPAASAIVSHRGAADARHRARRPVPRRNAWKGPPAPAATRGFASNSPNREGVRRNEALVPCARSGQTGTLVSPFQAERAHGGRSGRSGGTTGQVRAL